MCPTRSSRTLALDTLRHEQLGPVPSRADLWPLRYDRRSEDQRQDASGDRAGLNYPGRQSQRLHQSNQPDGNSNALPARWVLYKGQTGYQPITSAIDTVNTYQGTPTVLLTGSAGTYSGDNPPALESRPCTWPIISQGESYTFSCALKATGHMAPACRHPSKSPDTTHPGRTSQAAMDPL
jgi:hypothetical protein